MHGALIVEARRHRSIPAVRVGRLLQETAHPTGSASLTMHEPGSPLAAGLTAAEPDMVTGAARDQGHDCQVTTATAIAEEFLKLPRAARPRRAGGPSALHRRLVGHRQDRGGRDRPAALMAGVVDHQGVTALVEHGGRARRAVPLDAPLP